MRIRVLFLMVSIFIFAGCNQGGSGDSENVGESEQQSKGTEVNIAIKMEALYLQTISGPLKKMHNKQVGGDSEMKITALEFDASDILQGQLIIENVEAAVSETMDVTVYLDEDTYAAQLNQTIILKPGIYNFTLLVSKNDTSYIGKSIYQTISEANGNIDILLKPVIGNVVHNISVVDSLTELSFEFNSQQLSGLTNPGLGIIIDDSDEAIFSINNITGISTGYLNIEEGTHSISLKLYDGSIQVGKSPEYQKEITINSGEKIYIDIIALHAETTFHFEEGGVEANFEFIIPSEIIDETNGVSNLQIILTLVNNGTITEVELDLIEEDGVYKAYATLENIDYGDTALSLSFVNTYTEANAEFASCNSAFDINSNNQTLNCDINLNRESVITGNILSILGVNVVSETGEPIAGAVISESGEILGITGAGGFGTSGYVKLFLKPETHILTITSDGGDTEVTVDLQPLEVKNINVLISEEAGDIGGTITTAEISSNIALQSFVPVTFGQAFKPGEVPAGSSISVVMDQENIPIQADIKATHADGSVRHAILSTVIPEVGTENKTLSIESIGTISNGVNPVSLESVINSEYDMALNINLHNIQINEIKIGDGKVAWKEGDVITLQLNGSTYQYTMHGEGDYQLGDDLGTNESYGKKAADSLKTMILNENQDVNIDTYNDHMYIKGTKHLLSFSIIVSNSGDAPISNTILTVPSDSVEYNLQVKDVLTKAMEEGKYQTWLQGDIASEWIVSTSLIHPETGEPHPQMALRFYIRAYQGINKIKTDVVVENTWAYESNVSNTYYDIAIDSNGDTIFSDSIEHYTQSRWKKTIWWGQNPDINLKHNMEYLMATKAVPNYDKTVEVSDSALEFYKNSINTESYDLMGIGSATAYMPGTGAHDDIGPLPRWQTMYILSEDDRAKKATELNSDLAGTWSIHYRNKNTGYPVTIDEYPYMTILANYGDTRNPATGKYEAFPDCSGYCRSPYAPDTSHQPSFSYLPYLVSGDYYHMEEMIFWANYNLLSSNPSYREYEKGLFKSDQLRGQGWSLRTLGQAAYIVPDDHSLKEYFNKRIENNLSYYNENYTDNEGANKLGVITNGYIFNYLENTGLAPWQQDFFTWSVGYLDDLGFVNANPLLQWLAKFQIRRMTDPEFCWIAAAAYSLKVKDTPDSEYYETMGEVYRASFNSEITTLECAGQEMADAFGLTNAGEMTGYSASPTGYPSNMQPALAAIADTEFDGAAEAWNVFEKRSSKPDYSSSPQFAIVPREVDSTGNGNGNIEDHVLADIPAGNWFEMPSTNLSQVLPDPLPYRWPKDVMEAWSGGAYDTDNEKLIIWGGGHANYAGNEIYTFDIESMQWERPWGPTSNDMIPENPTESVEVYFDGNPSARHTYDGLVYMPSPYYSLWSQGGSRWKNGYGTYATWQFNFNANSWHRLADAPDTHLGVISVYDPVSGHIFTRSKNYINEYSPESDEWMQVFHEGWGWYGDNSTAAIVPDKRYMVIIGGVQTDHVSEYGIYNIETGEYFVPDFSGDTEILQGNAPGIAYHPGTDSIVAWDGGTDIYQLNLENWKWTKITANNSAEVNPGDAAATGTFGRFQYVAKYDAFIVVNNINSNVFAYKLAQ